VSEQLGLEQRFRQPRAVDRDKGAGGAVAAGVHLAGDHFFSGAALPCNQDFGIGSRDALDLQPQVGCRGADTD
jgi:hypothetical protein